jgi:hypothetical protein
MYTCCSHLHCQYASAPPNPGAAKYGCTRQQLMQLALLNISTFSASLISQRLLCACRSGYLDFLPSREYLPMFWPEALLQLLHGTSLRAATVHSDGRAMREDFEQVRLSSRHQLDSACLAHGQHATCCMCCGVSFTASITNFMKYLLGASIFVLATCQYLFWQLPSQSVP